MRRTAGGTWYELQNECTTTNDMAKKPVLLNAEIIKLAVIDRPNRSTLSSRAARALAAYNADESLDPFIPRYSSLEDEEGYLWRIAATRDNYQNYPRQIINKYREGIKRAGEIQRSSGNPAFDTYLNERFASWIDEKFFRFWLLLDELWVQATFPPATGSILTKKDEEENQGSPYLTLVFPTCIVNFREDADGELLWASLEREPAAKAKGEDRRFEVYDRRGYMIVNGDGKIIEQYKLHGFDRIPLMRFLWDENYGIPGTPRLGQSMMSDIIRLSYGAMNFTSSLVEAAHVHARLKMVVTEETKKEMQKTGVGNRQLVVAKGGRVGDQVFQPYYMQTPNTEIKILDQIVYERKQDEIYHAARLKNPKDVKVQSGVAKFMDLIPEDGVLHDIADKLESAELRMAEVLAVGPFKSKKVNIEYPDDFSANSTKQEPVPAPPMPPPTPGMPMGENE
jgi:hypothetical protein